MAYFSRLILSICTLILSVNSYSSQVSCKAFFKKHELPTQFFNAEYQGRDKPVETYLFLQKRIFEFVNKEARESEEGVVPLMFPLGGIKAIEANVAFIEKKIKGFTKWYIPDRIARNIFMSKKFRVEIKNFKIEIENLKNSKIPYLEYLGMMVRFMDIQDKFYFPVRPISMFNGFLRKGSGNFESINLLELGVSLMKYVHLTNGLSKTKKLDNVLPIISLEFSSLSRKDFLDINAIPIQYIEIKSRFLLKRSDLDLPVALLIPPLVFQTSRSFTDHDITHLDNSLSSMYSSFWRISFEEGINRIYRIIDKKNKMESYLDKLKLEDKVLYKRVVKRMWIETREVNGSGYSYRLLDEVLNEKLTYKEFVKYFDRLD